MPARWAEAEAVGDLPHDLGRLGVVERAVVADPVGERLALDVLHHQPLVVLVRDQVEDRDHVRVVEHRRQPGFALGACRSGLVAPGSMPMRLIATSRPSTSSRAR